MRSLFLVLMGLFVVNNVYADAASCQTMRCVRKNIDAIDSTMVKLIGTRLSYVKRAGELKKGRQPVYDPLREKKILQSVTEQALAAGYPPSIAIAVFQTLLSQSVTYEKSSQ